MHADTNLWVHINNIYYKILIITIESALATALFPVTCGGLGGMM